LDLTRVFREVVHRIVQMHYSAVPAGRASAMVSWREQGPPGCQGHAFDLFFIYLLVFNLLVLICTRLPLSDKRRRAALPD
jgi:hypothetical protein